MVVVTNQMQDKIANLKVVLRSKNHSYFFFGFRKYSLLIDYAKREFESLKAQNSRAAY